MERRFFGHHEVCPPLIACADKGESSPFSDDRLYGPLRKETASGGETNGIELVQELVVHGFEMWCLPYFRQLFLSRERSIRDGSAKNG